MGVHRNIDANFLRGVMPKVPSKKHPYENFGMPYVFLWILHLSFVVLSQGMKSLPLGTAYAVWTGIGAVGAALVGIVVLGESASLMRVAGIAFIVVGIVLLKLAAH